MLSWSATGSSSREPAHSDYPHSGFLGLEERCLSDTDCARVPKLRRHFTQNNAPATGMCVVSARGYPWPGGPIREARITTREHPVQGWHALHATASAEAIPLSDPGSVNSPVADQTHQTAITGSPCSSREPCRQTGHPRGLSRRQLWSASTQPSDMSLNRLVRHDRRLRRHRILVQVAA